MQQLQFYNSLTKEIDPFTSHEPGKVRIYNCGPTVYKRQHIGNMRRYLFADILRRTLELIGYEVREITNITDVGHLTEDDIDAGEDKLEKEAKAKQSTPQDIAAEQTKLFLQDLKSLNIEPSHLYPKASAHVQQMQDIIAELIKKEYAYQTSTGVYFDVSSFPEYGKLSGNTVGQLDAGHRIEIREEKKNPADFALWKLDDKHLQKWDSPWGVGYPGWHIECSAMALEYLGSDIDIHTGGEDNRFPHHENEIAQSEAATGKPFAHFWMHNRHLQLEGKKLAKREGEQITVDTLQEQGFSPLAFRLFIFASHYRKLIDFSWEQLATFEEHLGAIKQLLRRLNEQRISSKGTADTATMNLFQNALADDLNTPEALAVVLSYIKQANATLDGSPTNEDKANILATLYALDTVLGVVSPLEQDLSSESIPKHVQELAQQREEARINKQFERSDELRVIIEKAGYRIEDTPAGPRLVKL